MKKIHLILPFILGIATLISAQTGIINNAVFKDFKVDINNQAVIITYDLNPVGNYKMFDIRVEGTLNDQKLNIRTLSKNENITTGRDLEVIWHAGKDGYSALQGALGIEVFGFNRLDLDMDGVGDIADKCPDAPGSVANKGCPNDRPINQPCLNLPSSAGLGVVAAGGLGLLITGAAKASSAKDGDVYILYSENTDPSDPIYQENGYPDRKSAYDDANKEYKNGQYLMYGGLAMIGTAATIWAVRKARCSKLRKGTYGANPRLQPKFNMIDKNGYTSNIGVGLSYSF